MADTQNGIKAPEITTPEMRGLFLKAIEAQRSVILQAESMIAHYEWALSEMAKEAGGEVQEPVDPKMFKLCQAIVTDCT